MTEMAKEAESDVQAERGLELHRLDRALRVVEDVLSSMVEVGEDQDPDDAHEASKELKLKALDRLVKIQDQRAKLLGLYAPEKRELSGSLGVGEVSPAAAAELVRKKFGGHAARSDSGEAPPSDPPVSGSTT